jgi:hypothetical protein
MDRDSNSRPPDRVGGTRRTDRLKSNGFRQLTGISYGQNFLIFRINVKARMVPPISKYKMLKKEISIKITIEIAEKECLLQLYFILNKVYRFFAVFAATLELGQTIPFILQSNPKIHVNQYRYNFSFFRSHYGFLFMLLLSIDQPIWQFILKFVLSWI